MFKSCTCVPWTSVHRWNGMMEGHIRCLQNSSNNNGTGYILSKWQNPCKFGEPRSLTAPGMMWRVEPYPKAIMVCSRYSGGLIDLWIMLFSLFWQVLCRLQWQRNPLKKLQKLLYTYIFWVLQMHLFLKSKVLVTARLRSLIMDSEGDLGERGSLEIKDRCCCWCWKVQRLSMLYSPCSGFFRKKSCPGCIRKVYAGWKAQRNSKN